MFPVKNSSTLPPFKIRTDKVIDKVSFSEDDITQIIKKLNSNKSNGWDNMFIRMIKICDKSASFALKRIFQVSFQEGSLQDSWKKANIVTVNKKES